MNFKKLAEQKIDELSGKKTPLKNIEKDDVELVLEGLDEISLEKSNVEPSEETFEFELDENYKIEEIENLFDGYLGEQSSVPNPLEYGPNATYRNLREGIVYKKGPDNLWEVFLQDGKPGKTGAQGFPGGSGTGVEEVKRIANEIIASSNVQSTSKYVSSILPLATSKRISFNAYDLLAAKLDGNSSGDNSAILNYISSCKGQIVRIMYPVYDAVKWTTQIFANGIPTRDFVDSDFQQTFLTASDALFTELGNYGLMMHACLFWNRVNTATANGETESTAYTSTNTATVQFMLRFSRWFVNKYKNNSAFGIVSFGNEWNPTEFDVASPVSATQLGSIFGMLCSEIKKITTNVIVTSNQITMSIDSTATRLTIDAGVAVLNIIYAGLDAWCVHIYAVSSYVGRSNSYSGASTAVLSGNNLGYEYVKPLVSSLSLAARSSGKLFIIGETGINNTQALDTETIKRKRFLQQMSEYSDYTMIWNCQPSARAVLSPPQNNICIEPGTSRANSWQNVVTSLNGSSKIENTLYGVGTSSLNDRYSPAYCFTSVRSAAGHVSISSPVSAGANGYTVAMWIRFNATQNTADQYVHFRDAGDNTGFVAISTSPVGSLYGSFKSTGTLLGNTAGLLPDLVQGKWYHLVFSFNQNTPYIVDIFFGGVFWGTLLLSAPHGDIANGSSFIVGSPTVGGNGTPTSFQDVAFWPHAANINDVMKHAQGEVIPTSLIHLRSTGTGIVDASRYNGSVTVGSVVTNEILR